VAERKYSRRKDYQRNLIKDALVMKKKFPK
jgi:hypothetical protein